MVRLRVTLMVAVRVTAMMSARVTVMVSVRANMDVRVHKVRTRYNRHLCIIVMLIFEGLGILTFTVALTFTAPPARAPAPPPSQAEPALWHVLHDDGDEEDLEEYEMREVTITD